MHRKLLQMAVAFAVAIAITGLAWPGSVAAVLKLQGTFTAEPPPPEECTSPIGICTRGTLRGDIEGQYDFRMLTLVPAPEEGHPNRVRFTGESIITFASGAQLFASDDGYIDMDSATAAPFQTNVHIHSGTKNWSNATGELVATGLLNWSNGTTDGTYEGVVDKAANE